MLCNQASDLSSFSITTHSKSSPRPLNGHSNHQHLPHQAIPHNPNPTHHSTSTLQQNNMPLIRPANPELDCPSLDLIFRTTSGPSFRSEPIATIASHLYCHQYTSLSPSTCFVLETTHEKEAQVVGYILSVPSTAAFASAWRENFPQSELATLSEHILVPASEPRFEDDAPGNLLYNARFKPEAMLNSEVEGLWERWPAHFHVDILPQWQRQGWGKKLVERMFEALKQEGAKGVHLGMEAGNAGTEAFYRALGFERFPGMLDGGASGELGTDGRVVVLVMSLEE
jgi:ribosomal protein S18 acetylase RimI-like enzyme